VSDDEEHFVLKQVVGKNNFFVRVENNNKIIKAGESF
jgi:hypothetical protein